MENKELQTLYKTFDDIKHTENGVEFWFARELYPLLGYTRWDNFDTTIQRAKEACKNAKSLVEDHFLHVQKMAKIGLDIEKSIDDMKLTRYACYLTALNGDPRKKEVAFAQAYFVTQTRKMEVLEQRMAELERINSREKLKITEKDFSTLAMSRGVDGRGLGEIRSFGDQALFGGKSTDTMKKRLGIDSSKPLADFLPDITLKAKDLATAMTSENTRRKNLQGKNSILTEHVNNNIGVRGVLVKTGIYPENLPPAEDINKVESKYKKDTKKLKNNKQ
jgi:DNA-damage-inducible protein D